MRSKKRILTCVTCPKGCEIAVEIRDEEILSISGHACPQGLQYAKEEIFAPTRILTTTVVVEGGVLSLLPVKTSKPIPRDLILDCMREITEVKVQAPVRLGDVIVSNILGTGASIVATRDLAVAKRTKNNNG